MNTSHLKEEGRLGLGRSHGAPNDAWPAVCNGSGWEDAERLEAKRGGAALE